MRYLLRRMGFYLIALWAAVTINFILPRLMPGDPVQAYVGKIRSGKGVGPAEVHAIELMLGVDRTTPMWQQYFFYLGNILHGNFGIATSDYPTSVATILSQGLPWTVGLVGVALIISFVLGTLGGMLVAWRRGSLIDTTIPPLLTFFSAVPYFWMALGLVYIFSISHDWLPYGAGYDIYETTPGWTPDFISSVISYGILPLATLVIGSMAGWVLTMRNTMVTTLSEDYVLMAKAKGLTERRTMFNYAARNAVLPSVTSFAISLGLILNGSLLTEIVFNYPGIGFSLFKAVQENDYSLVEGCFLMIALAVLIANFLSELLYVLLDPRVRQGRS